jgi:predicted enzyme related to lactoylglutathione lyase
MAEKHAADLPEHRVAGVAGVFFRARSASALRTWYVHNLGIDVDPAINGALFHRQQPDDGGAAEAPAQRDTLLWSVYDRDATYFGDADQDWMISYRVANLDALLAQLRAAGGQVGSDIEESEFGRFGWAYDPEGNRFELWEPLEG